MPKIEMPWTQFLFVIAGVIIIYIIYLIALSVIRKQAAKTVKRNREKAIRQQFIKKDKTDINIDELEAEYWDIQNKVDSLLDEKYYPYRLKNSLLSDREKIMYEILERYCKKNNLVLFSMVRIADFVDTIYNNYVNTKRKRKMWLYKITSKHVDFLICDPNGFKPKVAIELDDSTHDREDRKERDEFVDKVYRRINLPIYHFREIDEEYIFLKLNRLFELETV